jgi:two-component system, OmpR family, phosphate regulon response regulator PhoB
MTPYVLIVEDEPGIAEMLRYNLAAAGFDAGIATDGDEALVTIAERLPDLVLLDWMLPAVAA